METIKILQEYIKLDSFLKFTGADGVDTGGRAKLVIKDGCVKVNGEICTIRGKKIRNGDKVEFGGETYVCEAPKV